MKISPVQIFNPVKAVAPQKPAALNFSGGGYKDSFECSAIKDIEWMFDENDNVLGRSVLTDKKTGEKINVAITRDTPFEDDKEYRKIFGHCYRIWELKKDLTKNELGSMRISQGDCQGKPSLYINKMGSDYPKTKGVGTLLHQIAIERSIMLGCEGRVHFNTNGYDSDAFHYKNGFRVYSTGSENFPEYELMTPDEANEAIRAEVELAKKENRSATMEDKLDETNGIEMYLPDEAIAKWKEKIAQSPCLLVKH